MANLDDFFKKKDGKKTKGKKFAVNNPLSLSSSEPVKNGKVKQEKPTSFNPTLLTDENDLFGNQNADEWKEFEEEVKKDYTGLKLQNLQINENENEKQKVKQESEDETEIDDNGQTVIKKKPIGPWKVIQEQQKEEVKPRIEKVEESPKPVESASAYIAPHLRNTKGYDRDKPSSSRKPNEVPAKEKFPALSSTVSSSSKLKTKSK